MLLRVLKHAVFSPGYWILAHVYSTPGLYFHRYIALLGLRLLLRKKGSVSYSDIYRMIFQPIDSTRYFEFDSTWRNIHSGPIGRFLDVSSPRMFPLMLLRKDRGLRGELINPDTKDLGITERLFRASGVGDRCKFHGCLIEEAPFDPETFDTITSISVVEHIPREDVALEALWNLLKPGGRLLLTVPCAAEALEEFMDFDEYGLLEKDDEGYVFGQRFYDEDLLREKIFRVTGEPHRSVIYGEISCGTFFEDRQAKLLRKEYPFWREPYAFGREYKQYDRIRDLPGTGVIALEFAKSSVTRRDRADESSM